jgi:hypothetical protein
MASVNRQYRRGLIRAVIDDTGKVIGHVKKTNRGKWVDVKLP